MKIGGFQKLSLIEYPEKLSCIVFTIGCNFRCPYCYNPELIEETVKRVPEEYIFEFLKSRKGLLDAVVVTGGEPTLQQDLPEFFQKIKEEGFLTGLETNGAYPEMIKKLINEGLVDFIAMDVKAPLEKYSEIVKVTVNSEKIKESILTIMNSSIEKEFRTTCYPLLKREDFEEIFQLIKGAERYALQQFFPEKTLEKKTPRPYPEKFLRKLEKEAKKHFPQVNLRV